jgi:isoquinoline 1-oxidoreductase beta subunit
VIGGKVKSFDASKAKGMPGVIDVVQIPDGVAVVADSYWRAKKARKQLTVQWDAGPARAQRHQHARRHPRGAGPASRIVIKAGGRSGRP